MLGNVIVDILIAQNVELENKINNNPNMDYQEKKKLLFRINENNLEIQYCLNKQKDLTYL